MNASDKGFQIMAHNTHLGISEDLVNYGNKTSSPGYPQNNGKVESVVKTANAEGQSGR